MSNQFRSRQSKHVNNAFSVTMRDGAKLAKKLKKIESNGETAIKRTVSDFTSKAPAQITKGIRQYYAVDTAAIKKAGPKIKRGAVSAKRGGKVIDGVSLEYKGKTLTPIHFKMTPSKQPKNQRKKLQKIPGQAIAKGNSPVAMVAQPKKYDVKMTVIKGNRVTMKAGTYIGPSNKNNDRAPFIPFQRTGSDRGPTHAVHTVSVPQMIDGKAQENIDKLINDVMKERIENHIRQAMKL